MNLVAKKSQVSSTRPVVNIAKLPRLIKAQIKTRLATKAKSGRVAEMSFRDAGIKPGEF